MSEDQQEQYRLDCEALKDVPGKEAWMVWEGASYHPSCDYIPCSHIPNFSGHFRFKRLHNADQLIAQWQAKVLRDQAYITEERYEKISGHCCYRCQPSADKIIFSEKNKAKTDFCFICGHRAEGGNTTAVIDHNEWGRIRPTPSVPDPGICIHGTPTKERCDECDKEVARDVEQKLEDKLRLGGFMDVEIKAIKEYARSVYRNTPCETCRELLVLSEQLVNDLNSAHDEICKLQKIKPTEYDWPEWSTCANSIRAAEKLLKKKLAKTNSWTLYPQPPKEG